MATAKANRRAAGKAATKTATKRAARPKPTPAKPAEPARIGPIVECGDAVEFFVTYGETWDPSDGYRGTVVDCFKFMLESGLTQYCAIIRERSSGEIVPILVGEDLKVLTDGHGRKFELQASPAADQVDAREELQELIRRQRPTPHEVLWNTAQRIREEAKDVLIPRLEGALAMMAHVGDSGDELDGDSVFAVKHAIHGAIDRAEQHILEKMNALQELVKQVNESN